MENRIPHRSVFPLVGPARKTALARILSTEAPGCAHAIMLVAVCALSAFSDVHVLAGSGPDYPLAVDSVFFFAWFDSAGRRDSLVTALPASFYAELRDNIDSVYNYATAFSLRRKELSGCHSGLRYGSCLSFTTLGTTTLKILFSCGNFSSGKLLTATDQYPFVVKLTKGFSDKLRKLARKK
jgi:hypothetical protein